MTNIQSNSRTTSRAKRKKGKLILFGSIGIVLILIAFVSYSIFSPDDNKAGSKIDDYASAKDSKKNDNNGVKETSTTVQTIEDPSSQDNDDSSLAPEAPEQTGVKHATSYDSKSQDWQEMLQAISTATRIDQSNMTVWFLGSDRSNPGGSVGTVSAKTRGSQKYRVYIIWDGSSYKATKVEPAS